MTTSSIEARIHKNVEVPDCDGAEHPADEVPASGVDLDPGWGRCRRNPTLTHLKLNSIFPIFLLILSTKNLEFLGASMIFN